MGIDNKKLLERAADLMVRMLAHAAETNWRGLERVIAYDSTKEGTSSSPLS